MRLRCKIYRTSRPPMRSVQRGAGTTGQGRIRRGAFPNAGGLPFVGSRDAGIGALAATTYRAWDASQASDDLLLILCRHIVGCARSICGCLGEPLLYPFASVPVFVNCASGVVYPRKLSRLRPASTERM